MFMISRREIILGVIAVLLFAGLVAAYVRYDHMAMKSVDEERRYSHLASRALTAESLILDIRRVEKDFLLHRDISRTGLFDRRFDEIRSVLAEFHGSNLETDALKLEDQLRRYRTSVKSLIAKRVQLGMTEQDGLEGRLRIAVHEAESLLTNLEDHLLMADMLMMRRHEKDFMMRLQSKYIDQFDARFKKFVSELDRRGHDSATETRLRSLMQNYGLGFREWAAIRIELAEVLKDVEVHYSGVADGINQLNRQYETWAADHSSSFRSQPELGLLRRLL